MSLADDLISAGKAVDTFLPEPERGIFLLVIDGAEFVEAALAAKSAGLAKETFLQAIEGALKAASDAKMKAELGNT